MAIGDYSLSALQMKRKLTDALNSLPDIAERTNNTTKHQILSIALATLIPKAPKFQAGTIVLSLSLKKGKCENTETRLKSDWRPDELAEASFRQRLDASLFPAEISSGQSAKKAQSFSTCLSNGNNKHTRK